MSVFGFDTALSTLGHFGTGLTNTFDVNIDNPCTLDDICEKIDTCCASILLAIANLTIVVNNISGAEHSLLLERHEDLYKLIKRIFSDQRNQSQIIESLVRSNTEIKSKLGILNSQGGIGYDNPHK